MICTSDLHMVVGFPPLIRFSGELVPLEHPVLTAESNREILFEILTPDQQAPTRTMLSEFLRAVIAQQLLRTSDGRGRCAANEILLGSTALASMIREGKISQISSIIQTGTALGMQSMDSHLARLVREDKITRTAAYESH